MFIETIKRNGFHNIPLFKLRNENGIEVELCAFGAAITQLWLPDKFGIEKNIVLTLPSMEIMKNSKIYSGATVGPVAGRIKDGVLPILDRVFELDKNDGNNTLHGGSNNLSEAIWQVKNLFFDDIICRVSFETKLSDGHNGFPGTRLIEVEYTLTSKNCLTIRYYATTDKTTFLNLTNHTYWNLSGDFSLPAYGHMLQINSDIVYYNDASHIPLSSTTVKDTPFDFRCTSSIHDAMKRDASHEQLLNAKGYNNTFILNNPLAAILIDEISGRKLTIETDYPCLVFYSGGYLGKDVTYDGQVLSSGCCLAFEMQYLPDAPRIMGKNTPLLYKEQTYNKTISFHFDVLK